MPRVLGLIPAKAGSTRLPGKNILPVGGKSMLARAGEALTDSGVCDRVVVSTEDEGVANVARALGLDVPFLRPMNLARDPAGVVQVALHCLEILQGQGEFYDTLVITLPTSPFRTSEHVRDAYRHYCEVGAQFLMSVSAYDHTPFAALKSEDGVLTPWFPDYFGRKSQEMPAAFRPDGALHVLDVPAFVKAGTYFGQPLYAYEMPWPCGTDIDTPADLAIAEALVQAGVAR